MIFTKLVLLMVLYGGLPEEHHELAVVELFTSQGCSSCPPADALLAELAKKPGVLALSFHVDYWDYLGWRDPYARRVFSQRQQRYSKVLKKRMYTPQMIVNGKKVFVGSDRNEARSALETAMAKEPPVDVRIEKVDWGKNRVSVRFRLTGHRGYPARVNLAVYQATTDNQVNSGENRGRRLRHTNVVRAFGSIEADTVGMGSLSVRLPEKLDRASLALVLYAQHGETLAILGAAEAK